MTMLQLDTVITASSNEAIARAEQAASRAMGMLFQGGVATRHDAPIPIPKKKEEEKVGEKKIPAPEEAVGEQGNEFTKAPADPNAAAMDKWKGTAASTDGTLPAVESSVDLTQVISQSFNLGGAPK